MLNLFKEKMLVSLVVIMLGALVFGSISSLATTITPSSSTNNTVNTAADDETVGAAVNNTNTNTNVNTNKNSNTNTNKNTNTNTNKNTNTNTNTNKNTNTASKLPYAGTDSSLIFVVIALSASAVYAYKKVSDYNV